MTPQEFVENLIGNGQGVTQQTLRNLVLDAILQWEVQKSTTELQTDGMPDSYTGDPLSVARCSKHGFYDIREIRCPKCQLK